MNYTSTYNTRGIFRFRFWVVDRWTYVNVDDRLPMVLRKDGAYPWAADVGIYNTWYPALIEKAAAKLYGSYQALGGGNGAEGLRLVTGMPVTYQTYKTEASLHEAITRFKSKGFLMLAGIDQTVTYRTKKWKGTKSSMGTSTVHEGH